MAALRNEYTLPEPVFRSLRPLEPTFNVQKMSWEQELDSIVWDPGSLPHCVHRGGTEAPGRCPGSPGFGYAIAGVFQ